MHNNTYTVLISKRITDIDTILQTSPRYQFGNRRYQESKISTAMSENNNKVTRGVSRDLSVRPAWNGRENVDCQKPQVGPEQDVRLI